MYPLAAGLSLLIGLALGLLGGGGSILTVAILVYALGLEEKQAIATSLVVVAVTSAAALVPHVRAGNVEGRTALAFGGSGMVGAVLGGLLAGGFSGKVLMVLFALMMLGTAAAMLRGRPTELAPHRSADWKIGLYGLGVGFLTGLVGAGGGFMVVPALVLLGGLPIHKAIGTSLAVIGMNSVAGYVGHAAHAHLDLLLTALVSVSAVVGALGGSALSTRVDPALLRKGFALFVLALGAFQLWHELA